jgi:hypothetical protein
MLAASYDRTVCTLLLRKRCDVCALRVAQQLMRTAGAKLL